MPDLGFLTPSPFYELAALLTLAAAVGFIGQALRQPLIVGFIAVGVLSGPSALNIVESHENIQLLANLGVAVLLFLVGLKLDLNLIKTLGVVSLATGLGQVLFTSGIGFLIGLALGLDTITSVYVAVALTFSSTIIIVKLLSDKKEVDSLHGRIAIGFLIVQDLVVVLAMIALSALGVSSGDKGWSQFGIVTGYGIIILAFVGVFVRFLASPLVSRIARSPELLVTFAISWAALLAAICDHLGLSKELGGLLAGVSLASTPFREAIVSRLSSLRDFLLLFFFIGLGTQLDLRTLGTQTGAALIFSGFVLIGNPLIVLAIMGYMGFRKRTGFLAGLTVAQISEFSLIFMAMGVSLGHINADSLGLVTLVGLITIALSVYMITYSHSLYRRFEPLLGVFERKTPSREEAESLRNISEKKYDVIIFGLGRYGSAIARRLHEEGLKILAIDFNPDLVKRSKGLGFDTIYGDASDQDLISSLPIDKVQWIVSAVPKNEVGLTHEDPRLVLVHALKEGNFKGKIALTSHDPDEADTLKQNGVEAVLLPFQDAAGQAVSYVREK